MIALLAAAAASAHAYVLPWAVLFEVPAPDENACAVTSLRYGPPDGKWERGSEQKPASCEFRSFVLPGPLVPAWVEHVELSEVRITYTVRGSDEPQTVTAQAETLDPAALEVDSGSLTATVKKVKGNVRSLVTSHAAHPVLLGDAIAARNKPRDDCRGPGPSAVLQNGESLLDVRPGLLSPSMQVWVAAFTAQRKCTWIKAATKHL